MQLYIGSHFFQSYRKPVICPESCKYYIWFINKLYIFNFTKYIVYKQRNHFNMSSFFVQFIQCFVHYGANDKNCSRFP